VENSSPPSAGKGWEKWDSRGEQVATLFKATMSHYESHNQTAKEKGELISVIRRQVKPL
jgi:hypothetical protein